MASSAPNSMFRCLFKTLTVSPALASGLTSQHHQLQQHAHVSGTAKGKAKLKSGQLLKRLSIAKKGTPSSGGGGGRGRREAIERITQISESCLNAPTPLRHLSPKERLREAKREELGLQLSDFEIRLQFGTLVLAWTLRQRSVDAPVLLGPILVLITVMPFGFPILFF